MAVTLIVTAINIYKIILIYYFLKLSSLLFSGLNSAWKYVLTFFLKKTSFLLSKHQSSRGEIDPTAVLTVKMLYHTHLRSMRSVTNMFLVQPSSFTKTCRDRAFSVFAPRLWNNLPLALPRLKLTDSFRRPLKTYLFTEFLKNHSLFCKFDHF